MTLVSKLDFKNKIGIRAKVFRMKKSLKYFVTYEVYISHKMSLKTIYIHYDKRHQSFSHENAYLNPKVRLLTQTLNAILGSLRCLLIPGAILYPRAYIILTFMISIRFNKTVASTLRKISHNYQILTRTTEFYYGTHTCIRELFTN